MDTSEETRDAGAETGGASRARRLRLAAVGALLCVLTVAGERALVTRLDASGVLERDETLFDADPYTRLQAISHDWLLHVTIAHPAFGHLFSTPIRVVTKVAHVVGLARGEEQATRRALGLWVAPLAAGAKAACLYAVGLLLGLSLVQAVLLTAVAGAAFSQVLFGCLPETYGPSGLALALAYLLLALGLRQRGPATDARRDRRGLVAWLAVGVLATAITVTNVVAVALLYCFARRAVGGRRVLLAGAAFGAACLALTALAALAGNLVYGMPFDPARELAHKQTHAGASPIERAARLPAALADTFAPPPPVVGYLPYPGEEELCVRAFVLPRVPALRATPTGWCVLVLLAVGAALSLRGGREPGALRTAGRASLAVLAFNFALHSVWGADPFLYSQHWHASAVVLLAVAVGLEGRGARGRRGREAAALFLALALAWSSLRRWREVLAVLDSGPITVECSTLEAHELLR